MIQEDKELLLKDLCARQPYKVVAQVTYKDSEGWKTEDRKVLGVYTDGQVYVDCVYTNIENTKPYLRPMSSMTKEEKEELLNRLPKYWSLEIDKLGDLYFDICDASYPDIELLTDIIDWLNAHYFDYRGLIEKGLAITVTEDNNPYKD